MTHILFHNIYAKQSFHSDMSFILTSQNRTYISGETLRYFKVGGIQYIKMNDRIALKDCLDVCRSFKLTDGTNVYDYQLIEPRDFIWCDCPSDESFH